jgi:hypothetical protein
MERLDRIRLAIKKGFTYDPNTGIIYGVRGNEVKRLVNGYISINMKLDNKSYQLLGHQFAYYLTYGKLVDMIDHIDTDRTNNKISNLREVSNQQNQFNTNAYGYRLQNNRYTAQIKLNGKSIHLGSFNTPEEAKQAYLDAKKIYHKI